MFKLSNVFCTVLIFFCAINVGLFKEVPEYIDVCKRDQSTIDACVLQSIEKLRPKLAEGIPELNVPGIEPFVIPELVVDNSDLVHFQAVGKDVKVFGASNFTIKSIAVDLDTLTIRGKVRFPKLHFDGRYEIDARVLTLVLRGQGKIVADSLKSDAEIVLRSQVVDRDGVEYIKFKSLDLDISTKDYRLKLDGLFDGNKVLGDAANEAINQNRAEFLKSSKPYVEKTVSKLMLDMANKIASTYPLDDLLPKP